MRKLILQMQITVNGFVAGPNGELDWMIMGRDSKSKDFMNELIDSSDCILMGRKMTEGFMSYWLKVVENPEDPQYAFARKMVDTPKVVFTKTLDKSEWPNTVLAKGELAAEVNVMKSMPGKDILVYGGAGFVSSLLQEGLIDELYLLVNPVAIGSGMTIFKERTNLKLVSTTQYDSGKAVLHYKPVGKMNKRK